MKIDAPIRISNALDAGAMARAMEEQGIDGAYTFDGPSDPFLPLVLAAEHSQRLELITAIAVAFARNPMLLAQLGNDMQLISKGRFILGLGTQIRAHIQKRFSMPWSAPAARMREFVLALRAIWDCWQNGTPLNFRGEFYTHTLMPAPLSPPPNPYGPPRVFLAGVGPLMTEVAGEVADGYLIHPFHSEAYLENLALPALNRGLAKSGRKREDLEISCQLQVGVGRNSAELEQARNEMRFQVGFYASTPAYLPVLESVGYAPLQQELNALSKQGRWHDMAALIDDGLLAAVSIIGTPDEVAKTIVQRYQGRMDRISPTGYINDPALAAEVVSALRRAMS